MVIRKKAGERNLVPAARSSTSETGARENDMVMEPTLNISKINLVKDMLVSKKQAQHVEWDLNKTSKTITETLLALTLMLYGSQKNVV